MTINFYLDTRSRQSEKNIILYIRGLGTKTLKFNTGEKIDPKHWDNSKQIVKRTYTGHPELNSYLIALKEKIKKRYRLLSLENELITYDMVRENVESLFQVKKPFDSKKLFYEAYKQFIEVKTNEKRHRTIQKYNTLLEHLKMFEKEKHYKLSFETINLQFYEKFTAYLMQDLEHSNNTIGKYISSLKTFLRWAVDRNINTHLDFIKFKVYNDKTDIVVLTEKELMNIYSFDFSNVKDLTNRKTLEKVRDVFCFQCFTGQRFSDIENLKRDDIKNDSWNLHTYKTKDIIEIPLTPLAKEILERYKNDPKPLPIISHQKTNILIKDVCRKAEINEPITLVRYRGHERIEAIKQKCDFITTHTARRTFVTISLEKGMKADTIMEITGHTSYKTFRKYVKITSKVKHQEMNKFWKKPCHLKLVNFK
jgi:integrase